MARKIWGGKKISEIVRDAEKSKEKLASYLKASKSGKSD